MNPHRNKFRTQAHQADLGVVGGGLAGLGAALAAARQGLRVTLLQDRPVLGGNASSEIRMWVSGASQAGYRETGIIEEILLANNYRNPLSNWSVWDLLLYEKARLEPNLTLLLNCSCLEAVTHRRRIRSVRGWQLTTQTWHTVTAPYFADCSGDSILAPLTGADFRIGREARREFGETIGPANADKQTMGMSCLIQARELEAPVPFMPPPWAYTYPTDKNLNRDHNFQGAANFWWLELGGTQDPIHDTEAIRDELLKVALGVWDHIKNHGDHGAANWALDWIGFLPGKRESRRYLGDYLLTQQDLESGGRFDDLVAYGGWCMDDHPPAGFRHPGKPTYTHKVAAPYGIPYRCLYSRNVANLFFAGRNISCTHAALSSTRGMATCAILGQAVGTAAAIAAKHGASPKELSPNHIRELQQALMADDCFLPGLRREIPALSRQAELRASAGDPEPLRNGVDRPVNDQDNSWTTTPGGWVEYAFRQPRHVKQVRLVFDSDLNRKGHFWHVELNAVASYPRHAPRRHVSPSLVKAFRVEALTETGTRKIVYRTDNNYQRLVRVALNMSTRAIRVIPEATWGAEQMRLFAFDVR